MVYRTGEQKHRRANIHLSQKATHLETPTLYGAMRYNGSADIAFIRCHSAITDNMSVAPAGNLPRSDVEVAIRRRRDNPRRPRGVASITT